MKSISLLCLPVTIAIDLLFPLSGFAQISADGTTNSTLTPTDRGIQIDNGDRAGGNLFHSFREFSVPNGSEAFFNNASDIQNIFSRVTGGNVSNIDGILRANGAANLFLINPAGIVLGEGARLQLGGSFYGSTADSIIFPDGEFSAVDLDNPPLITINAPIGLNFRDNPAPIDVLGNGTGDRTIDSEAIDTQEALRVDPNATIGLVGGELSFTGATIKTAGGNIELGSVAGGIVDLVSTAKGFGFDYSQIDSFQDIIFSAQSNVDASGLGAGNVRVKGNNISLTEKSTIEAGTLGDVAGGRVEIVAAENLTVTGNDAEIPTAIGSQVLPTGTAKGGDVVISANSLTVEGVNAFIATGTFSTGESGDIAIDVAENIHLTGTNVSIFNGVFAEGANNAGETTINANSLTVSNGALISTATLGHGDAGKLTINTSESLTLDGTENAAIIFTGVNTDAVGNGGAVEIETGSLSLEGAAAINTITSGDGSAGDVKVNATGDISFRGQGDRNGILAGSFSPTLGRSGNIELNGSNINLDNSSLNSFSDRTVGDITLNARENITLTNDSTVNAIGADLGSVTITAKNLQLTTSDISAGIFGDFSSETTQTGDISITLSEDLNLSDRGRITQRNLGIGDAGDIVINARNIDLTNNSQIINPHSGEGNIGDLILNATGNITLLNGSQINTNSIGQGNIGKITLNAGEDITLDTTDSAFGRSLINQFVNLGATGEVGQISVASQNLTIKNGGQIQSLVAGVANSGAIEIDVADTVTIDGFTETSGTSLPSQIGSEITFGGQGDSGNVSLKTTNLFLSRNGNITTSTFGNGNAGSIDINASQIDISEQGNPDLVPSQISSRAVSGIVDPSIEANSGDITISTDSLSIKDGGSIDVSTASIGESGNIQITATEDIVVEGTGITTSLEDSPSGISASVFATGIANGGNIELNAQNITLKDGARLNTTNAGQGNAGSITLSVAENFTAKTGFIFSNVGSGAEDTFTVGNVGNIVIDANKIELSETSQIQAGAFASATVLETGVVSLSAAESISFTGDDTGIFVNNDPGSFGNASNARLTAPEITLNDEALVTASNDSEGQGGNIAIATNKLTLNQDSFLAANVGGTGNAGSINIDAKDWVRMTNSSSIETVVLTDATGNGGNVNIETAELTLSEGSIISAEVVENATGNGGDIFVSGETINLSDGSQISVVTSGAGNAGTLNINATESIALSGTLEQSRGGLLANALVDDGKGGDVVVSTNKLTLADGATITVSNFSSLGFTQPGTGEAGNLVVDVNSLTVGDGAIIDAATQSGNGGNITFKIAENLILRNNGTISARALRDASGGNINLDTEFVLAYPNGNNDIVASAERGRGGNININAEAIFGIEERALNPRTNDINASSQFGLDGSVSINTPDTNPLQDTTELTFEIVTNNVAVSNSCRAATIDDASGLVVNGKGGVPPEPTEPFNGDAIISTDDLTAQTVRGISSSARDGNNSSFAPHDIPSHIEPVMHDENGEPIYIARGIIQKPDGGIILTAYPTSGMPGYREFQQKLSCD